jgi:hypothetical protein
MWLYISLKGKFDQCMVDYQIKFILLERQDFVAVSLSPRDSAVEIRSEDIFIKPC